MLPSSSVLLNLIPSGRTAPSWGSSFVLRLTKQFTALSQNICAINFYSTTWKYFHLSWYFLKAEHWQKYMSSNKLGRLEQPVPFPSLPFVTFTLFSLVFQCSMNWAVWGFSITSVRLLCQSFRKTMLTRWLGRYADPTLCHMPVLLSSVSWSIVQLPCRKGQCTSEKPNACPHSDLCFPSQVTRAAVSQERVHHRRRGETRLLRSYALEARELPSLPRTGPEARKIWEWDVYLSILSYPPPSYLNLLLMG